MKKVLKAASKYIFAAFGVAVLALLMSLTYSALARIFPDSLINRMWGLVMFDIAAMCWALSFVFGSESTGQYATAAIGFVVGFVGTLGMVAAEVILSSGQIEAGDIGKWMTYGFIIVTALHAALLYAHHATAPDIHEKINVGIARGEIVTEAIQQATKQLDEQKAELAYSIHNDIVSQVKRDLGLIEADPKMPILPAEKKRYQQTSFVPPILEEQPKPGNPFQDTSNRPYPCNCFVDYGRDEKGNCKMCGGIPKTEEQPKPGAPFQDAGDRPE